MPFSLKQKLNSRIKKKHKYTTLQRKYYKKVRRMITKYYNSNTKHRFRRIVRIIDRTPSSKRTLCKKFRSFSKSLSSSSPMRFGRFSFKLPFNRHHYKRRNAKVSRGVKNTLPQFIDYALSTNYLDKHRMQRNMNELIQLRNMLRLHPVLSDEQYNQYSTHIINLLTDDLNVMSKLQYEFNKIRDRDEWKRQSSLGFKVKRFSTLKSCRSHKSYMH